MSIDRKILDLKEKMEKSRFGGGAPAIEKQHARGKMTARERIELLMDQGSFEEIDALRTHNCNEFGMEKKKYYGDGMVTGYGTVEGRLVFVYSFDFTVIGGSLSETVAAKIVKIMEMAAKTGAPMVGINDSGGARIQEGVGALAGYASIFYRNVMYSGVVPQITAIVGPAAGGAVYSPAVTDFIFMVKETSQMFVTGPKVVKAVTHEDVTKEELGGAMVHATKSGVTHMTYDNEKDLFEGIRALLSYLPQNNTEEPPASNTEDPVDRVDEELNYIIPDNPNKPYDVKDIITRIVDDGKFFEVQEYYAPNIVIGYGRLNGK
ncbi:MAG TPA: methylmalonyl-CoA carboxyltransferase, partial [Firmicutes bacterium]|nr:methylmalonyl-CoA carboxyltransferase [Bacillota bacterium]